MQPTIWRENWAGNVRTEDDFVRFIDAAGCCLRAPLPRYPDFPSQAEAMGAQYSLEDTWFWKDDLHIDKRIYYSTVFGGKPGFLSNALLPALIGTNGAAADELLYRGGMSSGAQELYRIIQESGPINIKNLKRQLTPETLRGADNALGELERQFIITKVGITGRTRGTYGFIWDTVERWLPDTLTAADRLGRAAAETQIRDLLSSYGIPADSPFYQKVLRWER